VAVGDFNGDGKLDLAVTNQLDNTMSMLLGDGTGSFTTSNTPQTGANPEGVALGDFNGDGRLDAVVADRLATTATVLLQTAVQPFAIQTSPEGLQVSVDGTTAKQAPFTVYWQLNSSHTLATTSPQTLNKIPYTFASWPDGTTALTDSVFALATTPTLTATFNPSDYTLTTAADPPAGGTVLPASGHTYTPGSEVALTATPAPGYGFVNWSSSPGSVVNKTITMNANESVTANFQAFAAAVPTTTTLKSSLNPSFTTAPNNSVNFTAAITSGAPATAVTLGTVTFTNGATTLCNAVVLNGSGKASCTASFANEGNPVITATYSGYGSIANSYVTSFATVTQEVDNHTVETGNQWCNPGPLAVPATPGSATPYPSHIYVTGYSTNLAKLTLTLNSLASSDTLPTDLLLVGPTGAKIIPFAGVGNNSTISGVNITLDDAASSLLPVGSPLTSGTFLPTSKTGGTSLAFPAPAPLPSASNYAASDGPATLASTFNNTTPNGTWSLYAIAGGTRGAASISGGWCVNLSTQSAPVITTNPTGDSVKVGGTAIYRAAASGTPAPTVQWQVSSAGSAGPFANLSGAAALTTTLTFPATLAENGNFYRAAFTNTVNGSTVTAYTAAAVLQVFFPPTVTLNPANAQVNAGQTAIFKAAATGDPSPTVQWQVSVSNGPFTNLSGATSTTLSFPATAAENGNQYRAVFTNTIEGTVTTATTEAATLTVAALALAAPQ